MGTTVNGLPFPEGTDRVADGDNAIRALAEKVDTKALFSGDTGWIQAAAAGFTAAANFNTLTGVCRKRNGIVGVSLSIITAKAIGSGNITNILAVNVPAAWRPYTTFPLGTGTTGPVMSWHSYQSNGIHIGATAGAISAGARVTMCGMWMV